MSSLGNSNMNANEHGVQSIKRARPLTLEEELDLPMNKKKIARGSQKENNSFAQVGQEDMLFRKDLRRLPLICDYPECQKKGVCCCSKAGLAYVCKTQGTEFLNLKTFHDGGRSVPETRKLDVGCPSESTLDNLIQLLKLPHAPSGTSLTSFPSDPSYHVKAYTAGKPSYTHESSNVLNDSPLGERNHAGKHPPMPSNLDSCVLRWTERYARLQMYLKQCDESNQEKYIQMLRSLSAADRSKHAVQLEKRAIHLLLEEGKELNKMKALDVLRRPMSNSIAASTDTSHNQLRGEKKETT